MFDSRDKPPFDRVTSLALLRADVDHLEEVNDTHGHSTGDDILAQVGKILSRHVRCTDFVGRSGGEESACSTATGTKPWPGASPTPP